MQDSWLQQALQFPVPELEIILGQNGRRLCGALLGPENVIEPNKNANVIGGHNGKVKEVGFLAKEPVSQESPMADVD
jgi:hypothetical protein